jgi:metal-responsive CopG/Arc/MetJ family transcriptional regulator
VEINLSLPAILQQEADAAAKDIGVPRNRLIQLALEDFLRRQRGDTSATCGAGLREESEAWPAHDRKQLRRKRQGQSKKTAISLPTGLIEDAKAAAKELGISRSKLLQAALKSFLRLGREDAIKMAIDRYVAEQGDLTEEDEILLEHARQMTRRVEWHG